MDERNTVFFVALLVGARRGNVNTLRAPDFDQTDQAAAKMILEKIPTGNESKKTIEALFQRFPHLEAWADQYIDDGQTGRENLKWILWSIEYEDRNSAQKATPA